MRLPVEDILAVEHDIVPFDWADVFQQAEVDSIGERVAITQDPGDFARLLVDDARQDQVQAVAGYRPQIVLPGPVADARGFADFKQPGARPTFPERWLLFWLVV
jgi:hypothetical protein